MGKNNKPLESNDIEKTAEVISIALEAVPYAGGVLSSTANYFLEKRKNRRLNTFLYNLAEDLQRVEEKINQEFINSEDFPNLVEEIFDKASQTRQKEKLDAFRNIFLNTTISSNPNFNEAIEISDLINKWQPNHLTILKILFNPKAAYEEMNSALGEEGRISSTSMTYIFQQLLPSWSKDQIERTLQDLNQDHIHNMTYLNTMITYRGYHTLEGQISQFGKRVVAYITSPIKELEEE